jgi:hypothetical protein
MRRGEAQALKKWLQNCLMKVENASREQMSVINLNQLRIYLLPPNKIIQLKCLPGTNNLAYFDIASMTEKKCLYHWFWGTYDPFLYISQ